MSGDAFSRRALFRRSLGAPAPHTKSPAEPIPETLPDLSAAHPATAEQVQRRIVAEPAYRKLLPKMLDYCLSPRTVSEIGKWLLGLPEMRAAVHSPEMLLQWMVQAGGIARIEGTAELWQTTDAGREVLKNDPACHLSALFINESAYQDVFRKILGFCLTEKSMSEIEGFLRADPALENPRIYPSYLIDRLENAGGLQWKDGWQTTEAGQAFLKASCSSLNSDCESI